MSANFLFPSDGALVGSKELLDSPNVVDPTNEPIPTPSTYVDGRGEICNTKISVVDADHKHDLPERVNILYTRKGVMRSGDIHANFQCDFVFAGSVEVWTLLKDGSTKKVTYGSKQYVEIPPYTPHIFHFVADTVMAEWWEGRGSSSEFRAWFYSPYRSIVEQSYGSSDSPPGKLTCYKEITNVDDNDGGECKERIGSVPGVAMSPPPQVLLLDGGVSTHLESKLSDPFAHRELWSSSLLLTEAGRDAILKAHRDFLSAGADIISTVTYQAHYMPLPGKEDDTSRLRLDDAEVDAMLISGVRLAKEAIKQHQEQNGTSKQAAYVAASIGSLGGSLADGTEYTGNFGLSISSIETFHRRKLKLLAGENPEIIAFETIPCIEECEAILNVLKQQMPDGFRTEHDAPNMPPACWLSFACSDEEHLNDGSNLRDALALVEKLDPEGVLLPALGVNCCSFKNGA